MTVRTCGACRSSAGRPPCMRAAGVGPGPAQGNGRRGGAGPTRNERSPKRVLPGPPRSARSVVRETLNTSAPRSTRSRLSKRSPRRYDSATGGTTSNPGMMAPKRGSGGAGAGVGESPAKEANSVWRRGFASTGADGACTAAQRSRPVRRSAGMGKYAAFSTEKEITIRRPPSSEKGPESDMPCPPCVCFITSKAKLRKTWRFRKRIS